MDAWDRIEIGGLQVNSASAFRADHMPYGGIKASAYVPQLMRRSVFLPFIKRVFRRRGGGSKETLQPENDKNASNVCLHPNYYKRSNVIYRI